MKIQTAIYAGTFDPITYGHLDIIERASVMFERLIVAVACDNRKKNLFNAEERTAMIRTSVEHLQNCDVVSFKGLLVKFALSYPAPVLIRGLRALSDFEYEFQLALMNKKLAPDIETIFLVTRAKNSFISSTVVKELAALKGDFQCLVPPAVTKFLENKFD